MIGLNSESQYRSSLVSLLLSHQIKKLAACYYQGCERAIRSLCHDWARETGAMKEPDAHPRFWEFKQWLVERDCAHYLDFRSVSGADMAAEQWFDEELKQTWRN